MTRTSDPFPAGVADALQSPEPGNAAVDEPFAAIPKVRSTVDARGLALGLLAALATIYALSWAKDFLVPLLFGIVMAYTLNPLVVWLEAIRVPRVIGTVIVLAGVIGALGVGAYSLRGQMQSVIASLPAAATQLTDGLARVQVHQVDTMQSMQDAATQMEKATTQVPSGSKAKKQRGTHVILEQPTFQLGSFIWGNSMDALAAVGRAAMVLFLVFFLLVGGDTFKRKLVRLAGPTMSNRKITVRILDDINGSIQNFMLMMLTTNLLVGFLSWAIFRWIGLDNAGAWAVAAGLLHIVPYLGPAVTAIATGMAGFLQFDSFGMALLVAGASLTVAVFVGTFVTTWMTGRMARMNAAAVFIALLFWGWLWGLWGMLLSIPIIVIVKVVSQHVEQLRPVAELLGD